MRRAGASTIKGVGEIFYPYKAGDLLIYIGISGKVTLLRGALVQKFEFSPVRHTRRYFDEPEGTADLFGTLPSIRCEIELCLGDPAHEYLLGKTLLGAVGGEAAVELYLVDRAGKSPPYPCHKREFTFIPHSLRAAGSGVAAYQLLCEFAARGPAQHGAALLLDDGQTLEFAGEA